MTIQISDIDRTRLVGNPQRLLAWFVVGRAMDDVRGYGYSISQQHYNDCLAFFTPGNPYLEFWCLVGGLDVKAVLESFNRTEQKPNLKSKYIDLRPNHRKKVTP
jgi:hypothetical protein